MTVYLTYEIIHSYKDFYNDSTFTSVAKQHSEITTNSTVPRAKSGIPTFAFGRTWCNFSSSFHGCLCWDLFPALFNEFINDMKRAQQ